MNENKKTKTTRTTTTKMTRPSRIIAAATIVAVVASAVMIFGLQNQISQKALGQSSYNVTTNPIYDTNIVLSEG